MSKREAVRPPGKRRPRRSRKERMMALVAIIIVLALLGSTALAFYYGFGGA